MNSACNGIVVLVYALVVVMSCLVHAYSDLDTVSVLPEFEKSFVY